MYWLVNRGNKACVPVTMDS